MKCIEKGFLLRAGGCAFVVAAAALLASSSSAQGTRRNPAANAIGSQVKVKRAGDPTVAITVPWQGLPGTEHQTWSGATLRLQGTARVETGCTLTGAEWDPGDGTGFVAVSHADPRVLELDHVYNAPPGTPFVAQLRVTDDCGTTSTDAFRVRVLPKTLDVEVNRAIDHGLWKLHKRLVLSSSGGVDTGYWTGQGYYAASTASAILAMQVHGHLESGNAAEDPYVDDVRRGMAHLFTELGTRAIGAEPAGNPDANNNGIGLEAPYLPAYQGGPVVDAIIASNTPNAVTVTGGANVIGRTYKQIVQDLLDGYAWGQQDSGSYRGGWRYSWEGGADNSVSQWWGVAAIPAERNFGCVVPQFVKDENLAYWLPYSQYLDGSNAGTDGIFGYDSIYPIDVDGMSTTPSGVVQLIACGQQSTSARFQAAEHYMYRYWSSLISAHRIYGMFAVAKAMRLASPAPIELLTDGSGGTLDWYRSDTTTGDPVDGLARELVTQQAGDGSWGSYWLSNDTATAFAIVVLSSTIIDPPPVAVCAADPEHTLPDLPIELDGSASYHLNPQRKIVKWEWDFTSDGVYDVVGKQVVTSYPANGVYTVTLRVTDDAVPPVTDTDTCTIQITPPPIPPNADAGGPYRFCLEEGEPFLLDGCNSSDPDGEVVAYGWDFDPQPLDFSFDDADTCQVDVTAFFTSLGPGTYDVGLFVVDNNGLDNTEYTTVTVYAPGECPPSGSGCNEGEPLVVDTVVNFSELDGSAVDHDGVANGYLEVDGLLIDTWGKILVDVPSADFLCNGDVVLRGEGKIDNYSWYLPEFGPSITVVTCGSIRMADRSRIRSHGDAYGGHITLCAEGDITMEFLAGIECNGFDLPEGQFGGHVDIYAGGRFDMASELSYITVESVVAGEVDIAACGTGYDALRVKGRILADGTDPGGIGGTIRLDARNGGLWLPGVDHCIATGEACNGQILLMARTVLGPEYAPIVDPEPSIVIDGPDNGPCSCTNGGGGTEE